MGGMQQDCVRRRRDPCTGVLVELDGGESWELELKGRGGRLLRCSSFNPVIGLERYEESTHTYTEAYRGAASVSGLQRVPSKILSFALKKLQSSFQ